MKTRWKEKREKYLWMRFTCVFNEIICVVSKIFVFLMEYTFGYLPIYRRRKKTIKLNLLFSYCIAIFSIFWSLIVVDFFLQINDWDKPNLCRIIQFWRWHSGWSNDIEWFNPFLKEIWMIFEFRFRNLECLVQFKGIKTLKWSNWRI